MYWKTAIISLVICTSAAVADNNVLRVSGVVISPEGKPAAHAVVKLVGPPDIEVFVMTDETGNFELSAEKAKFTLPRNSENPSVPAWQRANIIANKDGFGPAWVQIAEVAQKTDGLQLKLVEDVPIQGQLLDADGRAIEGAEVTATGFADIDDGNLDGFFKYSRDRPHRMHSYRQSNMRIVPDHKSIFSPGTSTLTTADGRFEFRGLGKNRVAIISVKGRSIAGDSFFVATVKRINRKWARKSNTPSVVRNATVAALYPAGFHHVVLPGRAITGVVRDKETGKPIAAAVVHGTVGGVGTGSNYSSAETDERGRYEIQGLRTEGTLSLRVYTPPRQGYIEATRGPFKFNAATTAMDTDFELARGILVRGRVTDAVTQKPIQGDVHLAYFTLNDNKFVAGLKDKIPRGAQQTDEHGNFELIATPGPGFVGVSAYPVAYKLASFAELGITIDDEGFVSTNEAGLIHAEHDRIVGAHLLEASEARREIMLNFELQPLGQKTLVIVDREGMPMDGARLFAGMDPTFTRRYGAPLLGHRTSFTVQPSQRLGFTFHHPEEKVGGFAIVTPDSAQTTNIKLRPFGSVRGRVINGPDSEEPFSNVVAAIVQVDRKLSIISMTKLDADGNFQLSDVVPGVDVQIVAGRLDAPKVLGEVRLRSGQDQKMPDVDFDMAKDLKREAPP